MYLHIGHDWMIAIETIIAIFPRSILDMSPDFRHFFHTWRVQGQVVGDWSTSKTVILTDEKIFVSAISAKTLQRRMERYSSNNERPMLY